MRNKRLKERILALVLAVMMLVGVIPINSMAAEGSIDSNLTFTLQENVNVEKIVIGEETYEEGSGRFAVGEFDQSLNTKTVTMTDPISLDGTESYSIYADGYGLPVTGSIGAIETPQEPETEATVNVTVGKFAEVTGQFTGCTVTGRVVTGTEGNETPLAGITVTCGDKTATTDSDGKYTIKGLPVNETLTISVAGDTQYQAASVEVTTNAASVNAGDMVMAVQTYTFTVSGNNPALSTVTLNDAGDEKLESVAYGTVVTLKVSKVSELSERCNLLIDGEKVELTDKAFSKGYRVEGDKEVKISYESVAKIGDVTVTPETTLENPWTNQNVTISGKVTEISDNYKVQLINKEDSTDVSEISSNDVTEGRFSFVVQCEDEKYLDKTYLLKVVDTSTTLEVFYNLDGTEVKIDKKSPSHSDVTWNNAYVANGIVWANNNTTYSVKDVADEGSGLLTESSVYTDVAVSEETDGAVEKQIIIEDKAGNSSTVDIAYTVDRTAPEITESILVEKEGILKKINDEFYWSQSDKFDIPVEWPTDAGCGVKSVRYTVKCGESEKDSAELTGTTITIDNKKCNESGIYTVELTAIDNLGNEKTEPIASFIVDKEAPEIIYTFEPSFVTKVKQLFGLYTNATLEVTVTAKDAGVGFKDESLIFADLTYNDKTVSPSEVKIDSDDPTVATATYEIKLEEAKGLWAPISVNAEDALGNTHVNPVVATRNALDESLGEENLYIKLEDSDPTIDLSIDAVGKEVKDNFDNLNIWYNSNATVNLTYNAADLKLDDKDEDGEVDTDSDIESGLYQISCTINDVEATNKLQIDTKLGKDGLKEENRTDVVKKATAKLELTSKDCNPKTGACVVKLKVIDNAGNEAEKIETIYFDVDAPTIENFSFTDLKKGKTAQVVEGGYGYFFQTDTTVSFDVKDYIKASGGEKRIGSGVDGVKYFLDDDKEGKVLEVTETGRYSFDISAGYKGHIYIEAVDKVGQLAPGEPEGLVLEAQTTHDQNASAEITLNPASTPYKDANGLPLYPEAVNVSVSVKEEFAGIDSATYTSSVNGTKSFVSNIEANNGVGSNNGFTVNASELNLVKGLNAKESYSGEHNGVKISLSSTCNSKHTDTDEETFSVDTEAPRISQVTWSSSAEARNGKYYNANRVATIVIKESNWNKCNIATTGPVKPAVSWRHDGDTHTATVTFSEDGDYTFTFSVTDLAGHTNTYGKIDSFTIDKTVPVINVSYNNNSAKNGNYYKAARTATVTVTEHNFSASDVKIDTNGSVSGWSSSGDVHTATVHFGSDNDYTFDVSFVDMAGNVAADYTPDSFTVDLTKPTLSITGVEDRSANQGTVAPVITINDKNFDANGAEITLTGAEKGKVDISSMAAISTSGDGRVIRFNNFAEGMDDIYTLAVKTVDKAGNEETKTIIFSVNRDGSTYQLGKETQKLVDNGYTSKAQDIVIVEVNVDVLTITELSYTKDGKIVKLVEGKDYKVSVTGGEDSWKQYTYTIFASVFEEEGKYNINISSTDRAKNDSNNKVQSKSIEFTVDRTVPTMAISNLENRGRYNTNTHQFIINVKDNAMLKKVEIYMEDENGNLVLVDTLEGKDITVEDGKLYIDVASRDGYQKIKIIAYDMAGNVVESDEYSVLVTENAVLLFYSNKPIFFGTIFGILAVIGLIFFIIWKRRKDDEEEEEAEEKASK